MDSGKGYKESVINPFDSAKTSVLESIDKKAKSSNTQLLGLTRSIYRKYQNGKENIIIYYIGKD